MLELASCANVIRMPHACDVRAQSLQSVLYVRKSCEIHEAYHVREYLHTLV